jgi:uncharacterized protein (DUF1684 family)
MTPWLRSLTLLSALSASLLPLGAQSLADPAGWQRDLEAWRAAREKLISAPDGWLSLSAMAWLKPGFNSLGSDPASLLRLPATAPARVGLITASGRTVQLLSPAGGFPAGLTVDGQPAREMAISTADAAPSVIALGSLNMVVMERAGRFVLRVKDSASPARTAFHGLNWFPANPKLVVLARWTPYTPAKTAEIPTALGQSLHMPTPGIAEFQVGDDVVQLEPVVEDPKGHTLLFILRDATSTTTTYPGGRFLHTQTPDHGLDQPGTVVLDFNRLENPPCAYTDLATCPLPQEMNRLSLAIEAGEKRYTP